MNPTRERKIAAKTAIDEYFQHETFGPPNQGGTDEQPWEWVECHAATSSAAKKVNRLIEQEMRAEEEKKAKDKAKKNKKRK